MKIIGLSFHDPSNLSKLVQNALVILEQFQKPKIIFLKIYLDNKQIFL